ncbi:hypothetical protein KP509_20G019500 [Ceratopteris richardii]|uniref:non-specific serine/threonine protein kinase n=1 Tax=Ceratopteris richardii TaxID=49495 RepID=A0A8T2SGW2_CERRI|nr:hypothetical protein KP509_20G019500 [Ceratopteris richardii]
MNMNFTGIIAPDVGNLTKLAVLNLMHNNITGSIPPEVGNLSNLSKLLLNGNKLTGQLPPELGYLSELELLQIDENNISGPIPSTFQSLNKTRHFHMNNNSLNGSIPPELGRLGSLIHLLLDNNDLSGELPPELSNISTLYVMQLDNNYFSGSIPPSYFTIPELAKLSFRNCNLTGSIPDLSSLNELKYLDLSRNNLSGQLPSKIPESITTIDLSYNQLNGVIPEAFYSLTSLELLILRNNLLDGNFTGSELQHNGFINASSLLILDIQHNNITGFTTGALLQLSNVTLRLFGNPVCSESLAPQSVCTDFSGSYSNISFPETVISLSNDCSSANTCDTSRNSEVLYGLLLHSGACQCAYPLIVGYRLQSPAFAIFQPYVDQFQKYLSNKLEFDIYQVNVSSFKWQPGPRLAMKLKLFPNKSTKQFTQAEVDKIYTKFATSDIDYDEVFGPYELLYFSLGFPYNVSRPFSGRRKSLSSGVIAGIVVGSVIFIILLAMAAMHIITKYGAYYGAIYKAAPRQKKCIKVAGVKDFTFKEMIKATNNFDKSTQVGQGGYGKVYKGILADGTVVAIKRAEKESLQGDKAFYTEIEMLSRVHHRNLVSLIGYCDDECEQMLVYEFMEGGTLHDHLKLNSKQPLDFSTRVQIALGSAKGILYLHTEADPPIFHRDIKSSNILLDANRRAKVADFGLSKLAPTGDEGGYVSTVVKGTPGYLDPEYFLTQKLTDKSDVYSFGVVLLELLTGMQPITGGKNLVREVNLAHKAGMLLSIVDHRMSPYLADSLQPLVHLAISCCKDEADSRPSMAEAVQELESIWQQMHPGQSATTSETFTSTVSDAKSNKGLTYNYPYISSDIEGVGLVSGIVPDVGPR